MAFDFRASEASEEPLYSAGECPICIDSGALLVLKAVGAGGLILFCPVCGVAWRSPPPPNRVDEILTADLLAPEGVELPTSVDVRELPYEVEAVSRRYWFPLLRTQLVRSIDLPSST